MLSESTVMKINNILTKIDNIKDLNKIADLIYGRREHIQLLESLKYTKGQVVEFTVRGKKITGTIKSVNRYAAQMLGQRPGLAHRI